MNLYLIKMDLKWWPSISHLKTKPTIVIIVVRFLQWWQYVNQENKLQIFSNAWRNLENNNLKKVCRNPKNILRKRGALQVALQFNFWVASDTCNSLYLYVVNVIEQVVRVAKVITHHIYGATHYNSIITLLQ
jgi:hypothetical protein